MARVAGYETPSGLLSFSPGFLNGVVIELIPFFSYFFFFFLLFFTFFMLFLFLSFPWISVPFSLSSSPS